MVPFHFSAGIVHPYSATTPLEEVWGFSDGSVVKNLPANAGDTGLILDPGRSHTPWNN